MLETSKDFIGRGWQFPVEFKKNLGTAVMLSGDDDIRNSLEVLFATRVGERIMHSSFGSALDSFLFMPINRSTITYMKAVISDEILFNEPRIILNDIDIQPSADADGKLDIIFDYTVSATNNRYNYVYPYYLTEATNLKK
jgi:phage baseplate assembly protein W